MKTRNRVLNTLIAVLFIPLLAACGGVLILSSYGAQEGNRRGPHAGVDIPGNIGDPALAAADGVVIHFDNWTTYGDNCGKSVLLQHRVGNDYLYTVYCHLDRVSVREQGQEVKRGEEIGNIGRTGNVAANVPTHIHLEVCVGPCAKGHADGDLANTLNPLGFMVGCFDPRANGEYAALAKNSGAPRLVLTYPVRCAPPPTKKTSS